jgi:molecular chaperone HtpG
VLFVPSKAPFDLFLPERTHGIKLYVKRVFIMDHCKELFPDYLRFVKGVVDSEDLPLNVSREMLQHNPVIEKMKKTLVSKVLSRLADMATNEPTAYAALWEQFGPVLKEGVHTDYENKEKLVELLRFQSTLSDAKDDLVSLKQYTGRMREGQKYIYYLSGESRDIVQKSPHLEVLRDKSIEVLYLVDPIDEWLVNDLYNYEGKQLKSVSRGDLDLGDLGADEKKQKDKLESAFKKLSERIKNILSDVVKDVRVTTRLKDSPCCLVSDEHDLGPFMEKMMKAMGQEVPDTKAILEINGSHPIVENLRALYEKDAKSPLLDEWVRLLYDQALITGGQTLKDATGYAKRVNELLLKASKEAAA